MTTPYERTLAIMADREIPLAELARHLNIDRSAVSRAFKASKGLERHWSEVAVFLRVSADWLLYGTGPMDTRERESGLHRVAENIAHYMTDGASLSYAGQVTAGGGFVSESQDPDDWCPVALRRGWTPVHVWNLVRSVQVTGLLVDAATQAAAVQVLAKKATPTRRGPDRKPGARAAEPAMLAGLAKCPRCGSSLVLTTPRGNGGVYRYLRCSLANKNRGLCPQKDARAEPIEKAALVAIGDLVGRQDYRRAILRDREEALAQAQAAREERASLAAQRDQLAARIGHLARTMQVGTVEFTESMRALGKDVEAIDRRLAELAGILAVAEVDNGNLEQVLPLMEEAATLLPYATPEQAARTVRAWVQRIEVHDDKVVVDFYAPEKVRTPGDLPGVRTLVNLGTPSRTACEPGRVYRLVAPRAPAAGRAPLALR